MSTRSETSLPGNWSIVRIGRIAVPLIILALWQLGAEVYGQFALATPLETFETMVDGFQDGWMVEDLLVTVTTLIVAYLIAVVSGVWVGIMLGLSRFWQEVFEPVILGTYSIPKITLFPIFLLIFGLGMDSMVAFGWFHGVFPVLILTMSAMTTIDDTHMNVAQSLGLSQWQRFKEVIVPSILPGLVIGLRLGFSLTFLGIVIGEMFAARAGLGHSLMLYMETVQVDRMLAIITVLVLIAAVINAAFYIIEARLRRRAGSSGDVAAM
ncbi:ABC transporter permease [Natronococcus sp. A-GB7]|jgi:NitT/TauT family transport system permease protein|uniref:ABC transporter permease n=1 Tax=Natronococcus sp. A-GB7 TaxID=3037649 RepID=UPI00241C4C8F|nr:ABC transporter permease [Natronococcus sp. A-GB7]MDG5820215.1 ABC transporter permease [Natronococcus sp. A-GB7]